MTDRDVMDEFDRWADDPAEVGRLQAELEALEATTPGLAEIRHRVDAAAARLFACRVGQDRHVRVQALAVPLAEAAAALNGAAGEGQPIGGSWTVTRRWDRSAMADTARHGPTDLNVRVSLGDPDTDQWWQHLASAATALRTLATALDQARTQPDTEGTTDAETT